MSTSEPTVQDLQSLSRDGWEALGHDLCAILYGTNRVEDRLGRGNGLDAYRELKPGEIDGWQFRRFDDRLGDVQIGKLRDAVKRAIDACKRDQDGKLVSFTVLGSIDLQPGHKGSKGEIKRFKDFETWCLTQHSVRATYRGVTWVRAQLLRHPHLRPAMFKDLAKTIELLKDQILEAIGGESDLRRAFEDLKKISDGRLAVLIDEARTHFERGKKRGQDEDWRLAVESLRDAERLARASEVDQKLLAHIEALLAGLLTLTGPLPEALETGRRAVSAATRESDASLIRLSKGNLALALTQIQQYSEARELLLEVLRLFEESAEMTEVIRTLTNLLYIDTTTGSWDSAVSWAERLETNCAELNQLIGVSDVTLDALGNVATLRFAIACQLPSPLKEQELGEASKMYHQVAEAGQIFGSRRTQIFADSQIAKVFHQLGKYKEANSKFEEAIKEADAEHLFKAAADTRYSQAVMLMEAPQLEEAVTAANDALKRYRTIGDKESELDAAQLLVQIRRQAKIF
jgi:tetratricopeptide (TPR) repeat protein